MKGPSEHIKRGWHGLNRADSEALNAIEEFYQGVGDERIVLSIINQAKRSNQARFRGKR